MQQKVDASIGRKCTSERTHREVIFNPLFSESSRMPRKEVDVSVQSVILSLLEQERGIRLHSPYRFYPSASQKGLEIDLSFLTQEGTHPHSISTDDFVLLHFIAKAWHFLVCVTPPGIPIFPFVLLKYLSMTLTGMTNLEVEKTIFVLCYLGSLFTWIYLLSVMSGIQVGYFEVFCVMVLWQTLTVLSFLGPDPCKMEVSGFSG